MAGFQYRLQKVYEIRERKKKEQEQRVIVAQRKVKEIEDAIDQKKNEIRLLHQNMMASLATNHTMVDAHDQYIHKLNMELDELYIDLERAKQELEEEKKKLVKAQQDLEALIKHKDKMYEEWQEEQKQKELKQLNEIAGQRYFRAQQKALEEELEDQAAYEAEEH